MFGRQCETCEKPLSVFSTRIRNSRTGAKECEGCAYTASIHGEFTAYLNSIDPGMGDLWAADSPEYQDRFDALPLKVRDEILATSSDMELMLYGNQNEASLRTVAHDAGDGETVYHCPFCGSGNVVGRSDSSAECGHCDTVFTVQVQPQHPYTPQTINGQPYDNPELPGQVTDPAAEGTQPGQPPENEPAPGQESLVFVPPGMGEPMDPASTQQVAAHYGGKAFVSKDFENEGKFIVNYNGVRAGSNLTREEAERYAASLGSEVTSKLAGRWSEAQDHNKWTLSEHPYMAIIYTYNRQRGPYHYTASRDLGGMEWAVLAEGQADLRGEAQRLCEQAVAADKKVTTAAMGPPEGWEEGAAWPEPCDHFEGTAGACQRCHWARGAHSAKAGGPTGHGGFGPEASKVAAIHGIRDGDYLGLFNVYADAQAAGCDRVFSTVAWSFDGHRFVNRQDGEIVPLDDYEPVYGGDYGEQMAASKQASTAWGEGIIGKQLLGMPGSVIVNVEPTGDYLVHGPLGDGRIVEDGRIAGTDFLVTVHHADGRTLTIPKSYQWVQQQKANPAKVTAAGYYLTAAGDPLDEVAFVRHVAIMAADDVDTRAAVLAQVRAEREC